MGDGGEVEGLHQVQFLHFRSFAFKMNSGFEVGIRQSRRGVSENTPGYMRHEVDDDLGFVDGNGLVEMGGWCGWEDGGKKMCLEAEASREAKHENTHGAELLVRVVETSRCGGGRVPQVPGQPGVCAVSSGIQSDSTYWVTG